MVEERDENGWPVLRCRVNDIVERLLRNGLLDDDWASAAGRFREDYHVAHFQPMGVRDLLRVSNGARAQVVDRIENARARVAGALRRLGGVDSPAGSIVWHVIGAEMTLGEWRDRQRQGAGRDFRHEVAAGILIGAAGALAAHYAEAARRSARQG